MSARATLIFSGESLAGNNRPFEMTLDMEIDGLLRDQIPLDIAKELLVRIAIALTDPEHHERLAHDLAEPPGKRPAVKLTEGEMNPFPAPGSRDPIFEELDRRLAEEAEDLRRKTLAAAAIAEPAKPRGKRKRKKRDSQIAQAFRIEPWMLRRARYLRATGRIDDELLAIARKVASE
jgi:hypothetical protein